MTIEQLYRFGVAALTHAGVENAPFDASCLLGKSTGFSRTKQIVHRDMPIPQELEDLYRDMINRRISREPLQYILGQWEFMGYVFSVGKGVLIPRPETELTVEIVTDALQNIHQTTPVVLDLCAGSGCIGISIARGCSYAKVFLLENSPVALKYLRENISFSGADNAVAIEADVFAGFDGLHLPLPDVLVSNPPYIPTQDIDGLSEEVRNEPKEALDGGEDGLRYYRLLRDAWFPQLKPGGILVMEVGDDQADRVTALFSDVGDYRVYNDFGSIPRVVLVKAKEPIQNIFSVEETDDDF